MESLKSVSLKTGYDYGSLRLYVKKYEKELISKGVLQTKETLARKKYLIPVSPDEFIATLKKLIREDINGKNKR
jgi:hypothetical protein